MLRAVTSGVAAGLDFSIDEIDDLRLAVDEASAHLLSCRPSATRLRLRLIGRHDRLEVVLHADADLGEWPDEEARTSMAWHVISALSDDAAMEHIDGVPAIRFSKLMTDRPGS